MRIGICDDVEKELRETESWCRRYFEETGQKAELFCSACWEELKDKDLDLLLLDVEMPELDGIAIKDTLDDGEGPLIVFVTGYDEYMPRAFGKNVIGFVRKPIEEFDIFMSLQKAVRLINAGKLVGFEDGTEISSEKILFFSADHRYTKAVLADGRVKAGLSKSLGVWEQELADVYFIRISRSHLVNCKYIFDFTANSVKLTNGEILQVSRRKGADCLTKFAEYVHKYGSHA